MPQLVLAVAGLGAKAQDAAAGRALERKLVPLAVEVNKIALKGFSEADEKRFRTMLLKISENLADDEVSLE